MRKLNDVKVIKDHLLDMIANNRDENHAWYEGFVCGLNEGGLITDEELSDLIEWISKQ